MCGIDCKNFRVFQSHSLLALCPSLCLSFFLSFFLPNSGCIETSNLQEISRLKNIGNIARVTIIRLIAINVKHATYNRGAPTITYRQSRNVQGIGEAAYLDKPRETPAGSSNSRVREWHTSTMEAGSTDRRDCNRRDDGWRCTQVHLPCPCGRWTVNVAPMSLLRPPPRGYTSPPMYVCTCDPTAHTVEHDTSRRARSIPRTRYPHPR